MLIWRDHKVKCSKHMFGAEVLEDGDKSEAYRFMTLFRIFQFISMLNLVLIRDDMVRIY